jgi:hypothetical protein
MSMNGSVRNIHENDTLHLVSPEFSWIFPAKILLQKGFMQ